MKDNLYLPLSVRLRRARLEARLSQKELAQRAGVSQPLISYYERAAGNPEGEGLDRIARILGVGLAPLLEVERDGKPVHPASVTGSLETYRIALLGSLQQPGLRVAWLDQPAARPSGDVAFSTDLGGLKLVVVLDGKGHGETACLAALLESSAIIGANGARPGILWPDDILGIVGNVAVRLHASSLAAAFVALVDVRHGQLTWARERFPAPWLRNKLGLVSLAGESAGSVERGRIELSGDWLLVIGTDGVAHLPTKGEKTFWGGRDLRQLVASSKDPKELVERVEVRLHGHRPPADPDDRLMVVIAGSGERRRR